MNINMEVENDDEMAQVVSQYMVQGYKMQSNFGGIVVLKKKGYNLGVLIILLLLGIIFGVIYYLVCSDDVVTIRNKSGGSYGYSAPVQNNVSSNNFERYCIDCGAGLKKDALFCPNCGKKLDSEIKSKDVPELSEGN